MYVCEGISYKRSKDWEGQIETICIEIKYANQFYLPQLIVHQIMITILHKIGYSIWKNMCTERTQKINQLFMNDINIDCLS